MLTSLVYRAKPRHPLSIRNSLSRSPSDWICGQPISGLHAGSGYGAPIGISTGVLTIFFRLHFPPTDVMGLLLRTGNVRDVGCSGIGNLS
jgi:hypothetical protein